MGQIAPRLQSAPAAAIRDQRSMRLEPALLSAAAAHALAGRDLPRPLPAQLRRCAPAEPGHHVAANASGSGAGRRISRTTGVAKLWERMAASWSRDDAGTT